MDQPLISVLLPSYNYARYLDQTLSSVFNQTYPNLELIAVDDGSGDESLKILERWQNRFPRKMAVLTHTGRKHLGIVESYRRAFWAAQGPLIAFLESDDYWHPKNLEEKAAVFRRHKNVGVVFSRYRPFGHPSGSLYWKLYEWANSVRTPKNTSLDCANFFIHRNPVASFSHFAVRRETLFNTLGLKTPRMNYDWWILAHLSLTTDFYMINKPLCYWRIHDQSAGFGKINLKTLMKLRSFLLLLNQSLRRENQHVLDEDKRTRNKVRLNRSLSFLKSLGDTPRRTLAAAVLIHPLASFRFFSFLVLRHLLFPK